MAGFTVLQTYPVPDHGCAGPVAYIIRGAPSPRTCNICHLNGCKKRNNGGQKDKLSRGERGYRMAVLTK